MASRKPEACEEAQRHLVELGGAALGVPTHLGELPALRDLVDRSVEAFGGIDILVNNAANPVAQPLGAMTPEAWQKSFDVNLRGPVFLVQEALPHLKASDHASVINLVSIGAFTQSPFVSMYAAGKAALMSFTRSMAAEYAQHGIRVNAIAPGAVDTHMVRSNPPEVIGCCPRWRSRSGSADPEEIVGPALLLARMPGVTSPAMSSLLTVGRSRTDRIGWN